MIKANKKEVENFKEQYCGSVQDRNTIADNFQVSVMSFEELLPDKCILSYAYGNKRITKAFLVFKVYDKETNKVYYPVFSESVSKKLINNWNLEIPEKMRLFVTKLSAYSTPRYSVSVKTRGKGKDPVKELKSLIIYTRSMTLFHITEPPPIHRSLKKVYDLIMQDPKYNIKPGEIKAVNDVIENYIKSPLNRSTDDFSNLNQYIEAINKRYRGRFIDHEFEELRQIFKQAYPESALYF